MGGRRGRALPDSAAPAAVTGNTTRRRRPATTRLTNAGDATARGDFSKALTRLLVAHGFDPRTARLSADPPAEPTATPVAANARAMSGIGPCPDGQVRRVVCEFVDGRFVCVERCVPA